jgi:hypothetical protein
MRKRIGTLSRGAPWPEALAGVLMGFLMLLGLAFIPPINPYIDPGWPGFWLLLVGTCLFGAVVSWLLASPTLVMEPDAARIESPEAETVKRVA